MIDFEISSLLLSFAIPDHSDQPADRISKVPDRRRWRDGESVDVSATRIDLSKFIVDGPGRGRELRRTRSFQVGEHRYCNRSASVRLR